jgi:copper chaperone CopZ
MIIDDVACDKCINRIKSALDLLPGVISIKVKPEYDLRRATFYLLSKKEIEIEKIRKILYFVSEKTIHHYQILKFEELNEN